MIEHILCMKIVMKMKEANKEWTLCSHTHSNCDDASVPKSSSPMSFQIQELTNQVIILQSQKHKLELEKNKAKAQATLLKAQPFFPNKQVHELEIKLPGDLKEIPTKLEDFTKTVTSLTSQVAELNTLHWELPAEFLSVPTQVETVEAKLKTLDALPSLLNKVTNALNQFAHAIASKKTEDASVPSASQVGTQPAKGEKNANQTTIS
ncbi:hypothetical protein Tco_1226135 [Tanacetum coccineum]